MQLVAHCRQTARFSPFTLLSCHWHTSHAASKKDAVGVRSPKEVVTAEAAFVFDARLPRSCSLFWRLGREGASPAGLFVRISPVF